MVELVAEIRDWRTVFCLARTGGEREGGVRCACMCEGGERRALGNMER